MIYHNITARGMPRCSARGRLLARFGPDAALFRVRIRSARVDLKVNLPPGSSPAARVGECQAERDEAVAAAAVEAAALFVQRVWTTQLSAALESQAILVGLDAELRRRGADGLFAPSRPASDRFARGGARYGGKLGMRGGPTAW